MTITDLRNLVRYNGRDTIPTYGNPAITDTLVDAAIQFVANDFNDTTRFIKASDTKTLVSGSATFSVTTANFRPDKIIDFQIGDLATNSPIACHTCEDVIDWNEMWSLRADCVQTGVPSKLSFQGWQQSASPSCNGAVWPTPDVAYTLNFRWNAAFTTWAIGSVDATVLATVVNIPDDVLSILAQGMAAKLQFTDPDQLYKSLAWGEYIKYRERMMGRGGFGNRSIQRESVRSLHSTRINRRGC